MRRPSPASSADSPTDRTSSRVRTVPVGVVTFVPERVQPCSFFGVAAGAAFFFFLGRVAFPLGLLRVAYLRAITDEAKRKKAVELSVMGVGLDVEDFEGSQRTGKHARHETGSKRMCRNARAIWCAIPHRLACDALSVWPLRLG